MLVAAVPDAQLVFEEFVTRQDFEAWLRHEGLAKPAFWFGADESSAGVIDVPL